MNKVLIWEQGGQKNVIFSEHIISITQSLGNKDYCDMKVIGEDEPYKLCISVDEVLSRLGID
jgi:hypothetical protein